MYEGMPIYYCIMKQEIISNHYGIHRFLVVEKTTVGGVYDMYSKHGHLLRDVPGSYSMIFHREPDDTPLKHAIEKEVSYP